ncbi:conserved domain protein [Actinomyces sp. oral taxon 170 str. F0386]|nr:conserved domain protein [Actinomyces sp. oral taxon 170 str. F0386]
MRMYRTVTVGMAGLCRFSEGFWSQVGRLLKKSGIRTGWRHETERRRVTTRPEWVQVDECLKSQELSRYRRAVDPLLDDSSNPA